MKTKLLTALLITLMLSTPTFATGIVTFGQPDCGGWIKEPNNARKAWVLGFVSGLNSDDIFKNALDKINSAEQIFLWMDNYCKANPLQRVGRGGQELMFELRQKK